MSFSHTIVLFISLTLVCPIAFGVRMFSGTAYDHHPSLNPCFEADLSLDLTSLYSNGIAVGMVLPETKNANELIGGKPVAVPDLDLSKPKNYGLIVNQTCFQSFFKSIKNISIPLSYSIIVTDVQGRDGYFTFKSDEYFPIDNRGWDQDQSMTKYWLPAPYNGMPHNFHYCTKLSTYFIPKGDEEFYYKGNDDAWLFINDFLVMDRGGVHVATTLNYTVDIRLKNIPTKIELYTCKRHTSTGSNIEIITNIDFVCPDKRDYCGVCYGDGSTCCKPEIDCYNATRLPCQIGICPEDPYQKGLTIENFRGSCKTQPMICKDDNICTLDSCNATSGACQFIPVVCPPAAVPCYETFCDPNFGGCRMEPTCKDTPCEIGICESSDWCKMAVCDKFFGCLEVERKCYPDDARCKFGVCNNVTKECEEHEIDPKPFICKTAAVVSTAVIAGIVVAGAVAAGLAIFGGKKGYDYWKSTQDNKISGTQSNPLYENNKRGSGDNPLFDAGSGASP
eukprot:gene16324-19418_t